MYYLQVKNLSHSFGHRIILDDISFSLQKGHKVALVARNGSGKSTFLHLLMNELECVRGEILWNDSIRIGFLSQQFDADLELTVEDYLHYHVHESEGDDLDHLREHPLKVKKIINKLKLNRHLLQKLSSLSGGELKRVALAKVLMEEPDILILDEPTNHLDLEMIEWLEQFLSKSSMTLLMVTHDRYFLERVCSDIIELERGKLYHYTGNYSAFLFKKAERVEKEIKDTHIMKQLYRKELERVRKAPRGRGTKSVDREKNFYDLQDTYINKKQQLSDSATKITIAAAAAPRLGNKIMLVNGLYKKFTSDDMKEKIILDNFSHNFCQGERIGIVGKNGVGKSTFVDILMGLTELDKGKIERADNLCFGYFSQYHQFSRHEKVLDLVKGVADFVMIGKERVTATKLLERFLFSPSQQQTDVMSLSGGEKKRLHLLMILMSNPNFLILDEPTNDLDITTLTALEDFLLSYPGCLIIISHDRFFIDKIADRIFYFAGYGEVVNFQGRYSDFRVWQERLKGKMKNEKGIVKSEKAVLMHESTGESLIPHKKNLTYNEKREFESLIDEIAKGEDRKHEINTIFQTQTLSHEEIKTLGSELSRLVNDLQVKENRWLELGERV